MAAEVFPSSWLRPKTGKLVIDFIKHQRISPKQKKYMLYEWCVEAGVKLTASMVEEVTGLPAGEI